MSCNEVMDVFFADQGGPNFANLLCFLLPVFWMKSCCILPAPAAPLIEVDGVPIFATHQEDVSVCVDSCRLFDVLIKLEIVLCSLCCSVFTRICSSCDKVLCSSSQKVEVLLSLSLSLSEDDSSRAQLRLLLDMGLMLLVMLFCFVAM